MTDQLISIENLVGNEEALSATSVILKTGANKEVGLVDEMLLTADARPVVTTAQN